MTLSQFNQLEQFFHTQGLILYGQLTGQDKRQLALLVQTHKEQAEAIAKWLEPDPKEPLNGH